MVSEKFISSCLFLVRKVTWARRYCHSLCFLHKTAALDVNRAYLAQSSKSMGNPLLATSSLSQSKEMNNNQSRKAAKGVTASLTPRIKYSERQLIDLWSKPCSHVRLKIFMFSTNHSFLFSLARLVSTQAAHFFFKLARPRQVWDEKRVFEMTEKLTFQKRFFEGLSFVSL